MWYLFWPWTTLNRGQRDVIFTITLRINNPIPRIIVGENVDWTPIVWIVEMEGHPRGECDNQSIDNILTIRRAHDEATFWPKITSTSESLLGRSSRDMIRAGPQTSNSTPSSLSNTINFMTKRKILKSEYTRFQFPLFESNPNYITTNLRNFRSRVIQCKDIKTLHLSKFTSWCVARRFRVGMNCCAYSKKWKGSSFFFAQW